MNTPTFDIWSLKPQKGDLIQGFDIPMKKCPDVAAQNLFEEALQKMKKFASGQKNPNQMARELTQLSEGFRKPNRRPSKVMKMSPKKSSADRIRKTLKYMSSEESSNEGPDLS